MKNVFYLFLIVLTIPFYTSCEKEIFLEEDVTANSVASDYRGRIRRIRLKEERNNSGTYRSMINVSDPLGAIQAAKVEMFPTNNIQPNPNSFDLEFISENEGNKKFRFNQLNFNNGEPNGWPFKQQIIFEDIEGQIVGEPIEQWVTAQDNDEVEVLSISLKQNGPTGKYRLRTKTQALDSSYAATITYYFSAINEDGLLEKDKTIGYSPTIRSINHNGVTGLSAEIQVIEYQDGDDLRNKINPETNNVGVIVEIKNELGQIMDDDLFVVTLEDTSPEGIEVKNTKHIINANGKHRLRVRLQGTQSIEAERLVVVVPGANPDGSDKEVELNATQSENPIFVSAPDTFSNTISASYTAPITVFNAANEPIAFFEGNFTVSTNLSLDPVISIYEGISQNPDGTFTFRTAYSWDFDGDGQYDEPNNPNLVYIALDPIDGGSKTETLFTELTLVSLENTRAIYEGELFFSDSGNVTLKDYKLVITRMVYLDEERAGPTGSTITGQEEPFSIIKTCMSNGAGVDLFNYDIETNEPVYQNTDIIYVQFTSGTGENLAIEPFYPMFRVGAQDGFVKFKAENLSFLNLNQVDANATISYSLSPDFVENNSILFQNSENIQSVGFFNEDTGKWECADDCLSTNNNGDQYCGETDHF